ncbi:MAG: HmuY family protein [Bacteroidia bacterium]
MKKLILYTIAAVSLVFSSCEKPEKLWTLPPVPAGTQTRVFGMGENYENQIYFEFVNQRIEINNHNNWDVAFSTDDRHAVMVNGGKNANFGVARFPYTNFNSFTTLDVKKTNWEFDNPSGESDSMVFRDWCDQTGTGKYTGKDILYVFDLGEDTLGLKRYIKMKVLNREGGIYHIKWAYLHDTVAKFDVFLNVNDDYNYVYYNFTTKSETLNELMSKKKWDIVFTTYKKWIPDEKGQPYPYVLRGVISNPTKVKVAEVTGIKKYEDIDKNFALSVAFSPSYEEIGFDWKIWSLTANKYTVDQNKVYVIIDSKGDYYKLKFVDFYDDQGRKGYPKMAWEILK